MDGYSLTEKMRKARRRNRLTATEQALFYELVAVCNSEGWEDVFSCSNIELCFSLNIDEKTLIRARLSLINAGLLYYKSGKSKRSVGSYSFSRKFKDEPPGKGQTTGDIPVVPPAQKSGDAPVDQPVDTPADAPDYNKTETKTKTDFPPSPAHEGKISGIDLFLDKSLTECYQELRTNIPWMEQFCMNIRLDYPDFSPELFYEFLDRFFRRLQNGGETTKSPRDAMSHFANWLNIELEKLKKDGSRTSKNHPACGSEPVSVAEILCPKEGADASPDLVKNWIGTIAQLNMGAPLYDVAANGEIPTLADVGVVFGNSTSVQIITSHLESVLKYSGVELSREQMAETALAILSGYWFLNLAELCIFFTRLKNGNYGQLVWGKILNNQAVMVALSDFCKERREVIIRKETERMARAVEKGFSRTEDFAAGIVLGVQGIAVKRERAKADFNAFLEFFPCLPSGYDPIALWKAWGGDPDAINLLFGNNPPGVEAAAESVGRYLCDYNVYQARVKAKASL